jgi:hypothetical protein
LFRDCRQCALMHADKRSIWHSSFTHANITDAAAKSVLDTANSLPSADVMIKSLSGATRRITTLASSHSPSIAAIVYWSSVSWTFGQGMQRIEALMSRTWP